MKNWWWVFTTTWEEGCWVWAEEHIDNPDLFWLPGSDEYFTKKDFKHMEGPITTANINQMLLKGNS